MRAARTGEACAQHVLLQTESSEALGPPCALKAAIKAIFDSHKGRYGYRRVTAQLHRLGRRVNHKTVDLGPLFPPVQWRVRSFIGRQSR
ncbi:MULTISPECIES: IS3 family transposase [unclassified Mesorhizobium]|uniref:IS3 family transposase n=1 Tax=unclassified Mesorhizobium TaxID=325217 RepID=UPI003335B84B